MDYLRIVVWLLFDNMRPLRANSLAPIAGDLIKAAPEDGQLRPPVGPYDPTRQIQELRLLAKKAAMSVATGSNGA